MLIEATQRLWEIFKEKPELNGFVLIGGSALALQFHHRRSEDLDFKVQEIFALKALASADRSKSRDWFDLYTLFRSHGYTWVQFYAVFAEYSNDGQYKNAAGRLCSGIPPKDDEGYKTLVENPPQPEEIRDYFIARRNEFEKDSVHEWPQPDI
jgi:hypothetical protein